MIKARLLLSVGTIEAIQPDSAHFAPRTGNGALALTLLAGLHGSQTRITAHVIEQRHTTFNMRIYTAAVHPGAAAGSAQDRHDLI